MEIFNNTTKVVKDDLQKTIASGSQLSIAACFSIYAYQKQKSQLARNCPSSLSLILLMRNLINIRKWHTVYPELKTNHNSENNGEYDELFR